jgi:hypothetical protein
MVLNDFGAVLLPGVFVGVDDLDTASGTLE